MTLLDDIIQEMELGFENRVDAQYDVLEERYSHIMASVFEELGVKIDYEVDVSLVDGPTIQEINRTYRQKDAVTDVISFAFDDDPEEKKLAETAGIPCVLGEIFICIPRALEQAEEIGNTPLRELRFLFVHGLLHLLGYDHMCPEDEAIMMPLQEKMLCIEEDKWEKRN